jgi:hypothetical protein
MKCDPVTHSDNKHCDPVTRSDNNKRDPVTRINIKQNGHGQQQQKLKKIKTSWTMTTGSQQPLYLLLLVM